MVLLVLAAAASAAADRPVRPAAATPATATVRIGRAVEVRAGQLAAGETNLLRKTVVHERDGSRQAATLIEFY